MQAFTVATTALHVTVIVSAPTATDTTAPDTSLTSGPSYTRLTSRVAVPHGNKARLDSNQKLTEKLAAGKRTMMKLTLSKNAKAAVLEALRQHKEVTVRLGGTATGVPGPKASARLTFSAKR